MTRAKKPNRPAAQPDGKRGDIVLQLNDGEIIHQTPLADNPSPRRPRHYRPPTKRQISCLMIARRIIGLPLWNQLKNQLGIVTPGIYDLTFGDAYRLIGHIDSILDTEAAAK